MDKNLQIIFLEEIQYQCEFIISSYNDLIQLIQEVNIPKFRAWASIQSILTATANISKIFRPQNHSDKRLDKEMKERGEELKKILSISGDSSLLSRDIRNHFEHFDERLHTWAKESSIFIEISDPRELFTLIPTLTYLQSHTWPISTNMNY